MSSLIEAYHSKADVLYQEKRAVENLYEQAIMNYVTSDKAHQKMMESLTEFFFSTVIYLSQRDNSVVAYEGDYESGYNWSKEECEIIFGKYAKAVNSLIEYVEQSISESYCGYDEYFELGIYAGNKAFVDLVAQETEWLDYYRYELQFCITKFGHAAKSNFIRLIKQDIQEVLFEALKKDSEVLSCMKFNYDFCDYVEEKYDIDLSNIEFEELSDRLPKHLHCKAFNLWDIYLEFLSTIESKGE